MKELVNIRSFIEKDELVKAIDALDRLVEYTNKDTYNEISTLKGRFFRLEKEVRMGTLKYKEISSEKTKIAIAILGLCDLVNQEQVR